MNLQDINPKDLAQRIVAARKARDLSQDDAAQHLGLSRPTYIAIEKGTRLVKTSEVILLAELFGRSVHDLVSEREYISEFMPQFRLTQIAQINPEAVVDAVRLFKEVCDNFLWLEKILEVDRVRFPYIAEYPISGTRTSVAVLAEEIATLERARLSVGQGPLPNILDILEAEVGLRVFILPLKDFRIAGMFAFTDLLGGCILVNGQHPRTRQAWSVAHEYAHFLTERYQTEVTVVFDYDRKPRSEQFADLFAASFLMPAAGLRQRFTNVLQSHSGFTVADICFLADQYGVSVEAMTRRLEHLGCIKTGMWAKMSASGFDVGKAQAELHIPAREAEPIHFPERYTRLAVQAFQEEKISEGQLARLLQSNRVQVRETVESMTRYSMVSVIGKPYELDLNVGDIVDLATIERD